MRFAKNGYFCKNFTVMESKLVLYNTLTRRKEAFEPINPEQIGRAHV